MGKEPVIQNKTYFCQLPTKVFRQLVNRSITRIIFEPDGGSRVCFEAYPHEKIFWEDFREYSPTEKEKDAQFLVMDNNNKCFVAKWDDEHKDFYLITPSGTREILYDIEYWQKVQG